MPSVINCLDDMWVLHHDMERFGFTTWFGTVLIYIMIWNGFDLHHDFERFWFTSWFGTILIYSVIWSSFDLHNNLWAIWSGVPRTDVLGTCQTVYINTRVIPDRILCTCQIKYYYWHSNIFFLLVFTFIITQKYVCNIYKFINILYLLYYDI